MVKGWKWQLAGIILTAITVLSFAFGLIGLSTKTAVWADDGSWVGWRTGFDNGVTFFWIAFATMLVLLVLGAILYGLFRWAASLGWGRR